MVEIPQLNESEEITKFYIHYFIPYTNFHWWGAEYDPETEVYYGYVCLDDAQNAEWGSFSKKELEELPFVLKDTEFEPTNIEKIVKN